MKDVPHKPGVLTSRGSIPRMLVGRAIVGAAAALAVSITGCSGSDNEPSEGSSNTETSAEAWADDVCTVISSWKGTVTGATSTLDDPKDVSVNDFNDAVGSVISATETLVDEIAALGPPDTDAGAAALEQVSGLSESLESELAVLDDAFSADTATIDDLVTQTSTITQSVSTMITDVETTLDSVAELDGATELQDAFAGAGSCQQVASG